MVDYTKKSLKKCMFRSALGIVRHLWTTPLLWLYLYVNVTKLGLTIGM